MCIREIKGIFKKCMYCNSFEYEKKDCFNYDEDLEKEVIFINEDRLRFSATEQSLELNFRRRGIKNLIVEFDGRISGLPVREAKSYIIEVEIGGIVTTLKPPKEALIKGVKLLGRQQIEITYLMLLVSNFF